MISDRVSDDIHYQMKIMNTVIPLTLCNRQFPKPVLLQTVKTQMKCSRMLHFIRVYTVCEGKKDLQTKEYTIFENYNLTPLDMYNGLSHVYCIKPEFV